jgi:hypothetical protein
MFTYGLSKFIARFLRRKHAKIFHDSIDRIDFEENLARSRPASMCCQIRQFDADAPKIIRKQP